MNRQHPNNISKTIQDFNRECAEEKARRCPKPSPKYEKRIQNYCIDLAAKLGEGTFSKVYQAKDQRKDTPVAVKIVELRKIQELGIEDLFWEEINIIRRLKHPNVVSCIEYFKTANNCYTVYEFCESGDLAHRLKKGHLGDKEDLRQANGVIKDIFQGLLYLESMSIVHRDIKAANILLAGGKAKIGDFGFATHCKRDFKDVSIGSPAYMSPEGLLHNVYGPKTDVWSFGVLLYEVLHGQTPFHSCESQTQLKQRVQVPVNWDQLKGSLPSPLKRLILKCLKVNSAQRPTFSQLLNDQYIQKIYQESCARHASKSNYTKVTSDSENNLTPFALKKCQRVSLTPFTPKQQRFATEDCEQVENNRETVIIKTEPQEDCDIPLGPSLIDSTNILELIDLANKRSIDTRVQDCQTAETSRQSNCDILKQIILEKFLILTQETYSLQYLQSCLKTVIIFKETLQLLQTFPEKSDHMAFLEFMNQLLLQTYLKASSLQFNTIISQIDNTKDLLSNFAKDSLLNPTEPKPYLRTGESLFELIRLAETAIDRQDIEEHANHCQNQQNKLVYTGNTLIISLQLLYSLESQESPEQWVSSRSDVNLYSSDQFFIWLYELQLKRMDRSES